jgi:hypothetical protein
MNGYKKGDIIEMLDNIKYTITKEGWTGVVLEDQKAADEIIIKGIDGTPGEYTVETCFVKLIKRKKTMNIGNLAAAAKALKETGPKGRWVIKLEIAVVASAYDEESAYEAAKEQYDNNSFYLDRTSAPKSIKAVEIEAPPTF